MGMGYECGLQLWIDINEGFAVNLPDEMIVDVG